MKRVKRSLEREGIVADQLISYCTECNNCWEAVRFRGREGRHHYKYLYYEDFPTYKRQRTTCLKCSGANMVQKEINGMVYWQEKKRKLN